VPPTEAEVRDIVRRVLDRLVAPAAVTSGPVETAKPVSARAPAHRPLVDEAAVRDLAPGSTLAISPGAVITPLARQLAEERHIVLGEPAAKATSATVNKIPPQQRVALGADHGGYTLKETLKAHIQSLGYEVVDCGTHSTDAVDYPDIAFAVARLVADGQCANGVVIDGAGIGSCMAANKVPGVRAALCYDHASATNSREHNHANVLTLGAGLIGANLAKQIVQAWLATPYGTGRHAKRVEKITAIEKRYTR
jgi:ribose 5-phosphate isomerase B